jgi:AraC-like DNA-binding protein
MDWQYHEVKPSLVLQDYIDCIWWEDFFDSQPQKQQHLVVPDNSIELIFTENPILRKDLHTETENSNSSHLCGLKTKPQHCSLQKSPLLGIRFKPKGFYLLAGLKLAESIDKSIDPVDCFSKNILFLEEQLFTTPYIFRRNQSINQFFENLLLKKLDQKDLLFEKLIAEIESSQGMLPIREIAFRFHISIKTMERKFLERLGMTPKKYAKLVRIVHCLINGPASTSQNLTQLAYQYGFADQSHFIKEVKKFTSVSPSAFFKMDHGIQAPTFS